MDKRTLLHSLMFGGSGGITPSGTLSITSNANGIDVTNYAAVDVNVSTSGAGSIFVDDRLAAYGDSLKWFSPDFDNPLSGGGYFEVKILTGELASDYGCVIAFGKPDKIGSYNNNHDAALFYASYQTGSQVFELDIRQGGVTTPVSGLSISDIHTIKVDKNYIYVNGTAKVATDYWVVAASKVAFGSTEGTKRYSGQYKSIKLFK